MEGASPTEVVETIRDDFKCSICWELVHDPQVLQCGHVFCYKCLFDSMKADEHFLHCPSCQVLTTHFSTSFEKLRAITQILYPKTYREMAAKYGEEVEPSTTDLSASQRLKQIRGVVCESCQKYLKRPLVKPCGHVFCDGCVTILDDGSSTCFVCNRPNGFSD